LLDAAECSMNEKNEAPSVQASMPDCGPGERFSRSRHGDVPLTVCPSPWRSRACYCLKLSSSLDLAAVAVITHEAALTDAAVPPSGSA